MSRKKREWYPGATYHVMSRGKQWCTINCGVQFKIWKGSYYVTLILYTGTCYRIYLSVIVTVLLLRLYCRDFKDLRGGEL